MRRRPPRAECCWRGQAQRLRKTGPFARGATAIVALPLRLSSEASNGQEGPGSLTVRKPDALWAPPSRQGRALAGKFARQ